MCLYNFNNKSKNSDVNTEEYNLLQQIYKSIESNDKENTINLTQQLMSMQSSQENMDILQNAIDSFK